MGSTVTLEPFTLNFAAWGLFYMELLHRTLYVFLAYDVLSWPDGSSTEILAPQYSKRRVTERWKLTRPLYRQAFYYDWINLDFFSYHNTKPVHED